MKPALVAHLSFWTAHPSTIWGRGMNRGFGRGGRELPRTGRGRGRLLMGEGREQSA